MDGQGELKIKNYKLREKGIVGIGHAMSFFRAEKEWHTNDADAADIFRYVSG